MGLLLLLAKLGLPSAFVAMVIIALVFHQQFPKLSKISVGISIFLVASFGIIQITMNKKILIIIGIIAVLIIGTIFYFGFYSKEKESLEKTLDSSELFQDLSDMDNLMDQLEISSLDTADLSEDISEMENLINQLEVEK